jgi:hypothetical protein
VKGQRLNWFMTYSSVVLPRTNLQGTRVPDGQHDLSCRKNPDPSGRGFQSRAGKFSNSGLFSSGWLIPPTTRRILFHSKRPEPSSAFVTAETGAEKATGGEDCDAAGPACGPPGDLDELRVSPIRMWVTAEDPEPVERQEPDIFLGVVLRLCDER